MELIKSYKYKVSANKDKLHRIENIIYPEWKRIAKILVNKHIEHLYKTGTLHISNKLYKGIDTFLSERYKDCINRQVLGMMKSKYKNAKNYYVKRIYKCKSFSSELKKELINISNKNLFFSRDKNDTILLARKIFKQFFGDLPSTKNINMALNIKIAIIEESKNDKLFKYYIKLSSDIKGKPIYIPILKNSYADNKNGSLNTSCNFIFKNNKLVNVSLIKTNNIDKQILTNTVLGVDIGLNNLFALNNGELHGMRFCKKLKKFDSILIKLTNSLKLKYGENVKLRSFKEYVNLNHRIKEYIKNEVNRILNRIFKRYKPEQIILENLNFKHSKLYKKTNRLLHRFGLSVIKSKLENFKKENNVKINYIDPAYTSQTCNKCVYVSEKNRKNRCIFKCIKCKYKGNADVNAANNMVAFFKRFKENSFINRGDKLKLIRDIHLSNLSSG